MGPLPRPCGRWAASFRNPGRHYPVTPGRLRRNRQDILAWLRKLGLERYEQAFRENEVVADILPKLTADDLKDIGVTIVGHRRKLLEAIAALA